jgi:type I restriction enzyme R subunit
MPRTMRVEYADKPMRGHGLMQAIARVNRVFKDRPGGLVVDYLGLPSRTHRNHMPHRLNPGQE